MRKCKMNGCNLSIILHSIKQKNPQLQYQHNQYPQKQQYPLQRGVGILEVDDNKQEEDLVKEEVKLYVIIVGIRDIFHETVKVLQQNVNIVKHLIRLLNNF